MYEHEEATRALWNEEPGDIVWVRGGDYIKGWREAQDAADVWNSALTEAGLEDPRAVASTGGEGEPVVRFRGSPVGARRAAWLLRLGAGTVSAR
ncbi:hypothetical protein KQY30_06550 [Streptomyces sp. GMY02]|uniref:hypothetical protein n=1 Tax=Streptomyces sp. GMY02 TaxID=1333528 RepID=UPI001C2C7C00|nr:hypothetical protein [Streptomyces sp. GMY02]QXE34000.1 hypothetical protein KQY30_06550 [Streptomyces sp. GMY02]